MLSPPNAVHVIPRRRAWIMFLALSFASAASLGMLGFRYLKTQERELELLIKNLFLAWIPMVAALGAYYYHGRTVPSRWRLAVCAAIWFFFFPNAPYIVTDFIHWERNTSELLWYYDLVILMSFAWTGLFLGYLSLYLIQEIARARYGVRASWYFTIIMLALSSFGIYLGRFARRNSWDVLRHPVRLLRDSLQSVDVVSHPRPLYFSATLFVFLLLSYCALYSLTRLHERAPDPAEDALRE